MIVSSFGLTAAEMMAATRPGSEIKVVEDARFRVVGGPPAVVEESFFDKPWAKWAIGGGVALMLGGAYLYTARKR